MVIFIREVTALSTAFYGAAIFGLSILAYFGILMREKDLEINLNRREYY